MTRKHFPEEQNPQVHIVSAFYMMMTLFAPTLLASPPLAFVIEITPHLYILHNYTQNDRLVVGVSALNSVT